MNCRSVLACLLAGAVCAQACVSDGVTPIHDVILRADSLKALNSELTVRGTVLDVDHLVLTPYYVTTISDKTGVIRVVADSVTCVAARVTVTGTLAGYSMLGLIRLGPVIVESRRVTRAPACPCSLVTASLISRRLACTMQ